jgi:hypothetical protein
MSSATTMSADVTNNACDGYARTGVTNKVGVAIDGYSSGTLNSFVGPNSLTNLTIGVNLGVNARTVMVIGGTSQCSGVTTCLNNLATAGANSQIAPTSY